MKVLASALALLLVGLAGVWLWLDVTAEAGQDRAGIVITGEVDPATTRELAEAAGRDGPPVVPASDGAEASSQDPSATPPDPAVVGRVVDVLTSASAELRSRWQTSVDAAARATGDDAAPTAERATEDAARAAEEAAEDAARAAEEAAEEAAERAEEEREDADDRDPAIPVQPAPVAPDGDDDDWEDGDGDDDDD